LSTSKNAGEFTFKKTFFFTPYFGLINLEKAEYFKVFNLVVLIMGISLLLFSVAYFLSLSVVKDSEKLSQYECGFEPFDEATRHPFDVHFYIVGILFLIFDVEVALLFP
jgi:NADH-quinone oxidoreductase subunit A